MIIDLIHINNIIIYNIIVDIIVVVHDNIIIVIHCFKYVKIKFQIYLILIYIKI